MKEYAMPVGRCPACGKLCFTSRKLAKRYVNKHFPGEGMTVYICNEDPRYHHYGHTPYAVKRGFAQRGQVSHKRRTDQ